MEIGAELSIHSHLIMKIDVLLFRHATKMLSKPRHKICAAHNDFEYTLSNIRHYSSPDILLLEVQLASEHTNAQVTICRIGGSQCYQIGYHATADGVLRVFDAMSPHCLELPLRILLHVGALQLPL